MIYTMLSSGTLGTLTGESDWAKLEAIQHQFTQFVEQSTQEYESWQEAWLDFYNPRRLMMPKIVNVKMSPVRTSSNVRAAGWSREIQALIVAYGGNRIYAFYDASHDDLRKLMAADSKGRFMSGADWFSTNYATPENVVVSWTKANEGVRVGLKEFSVKHFIEQMSHSINALAKDHPDVDLQDLSVILPRNTPDGFFEVLKQWVIDELKDEPTYTVVVGDTSANNLMQVCNLNYTIAFDEPSKGDKRSDERKAPKPKALPLGQKLAEQVQPMPQFAQFFGDQPAATQVAQEPEEQLPEPVEGTPKKINGSRGKDKQYRVRVGDNGDLEEWVFAIAYAHAKLNEEIGGGLFVSLPYSAPESLVALLRSAGIGIYTGSATPTPNSVGVGIYSDPE